MAGQGVGGADQSLSGGVGHPGAWVGIPQVGGVGRMWGGAGVNPRSAGSWAAGAGVPGPRLTRLLDPTGLSGESVEENANVVVRLLIRKPECFGPALRGEGGSGLLAAIEEAIRISEDPARDGPGVRRDRRR